MTGLVKAASAAGVGRFVVPALAARAPLRSAEDARLEAAAAEIERLEAALAGSEADAAEAAAKAREEGRKAAAAEAVDREDERLALLESALASARESLDRRLGEVDRLAALLARTALDKLVEADADLADLVARSIERQMRLVRRTAVAAIRVSADDFADQPALEVLAQRVAAGSARPVADPDLRAGECRMDLKLGHIDLDVRARWREMSALLEAMATGEAA